jgi:phage terminase large subunit-like protein
VGVLLDNDAALLKKLYPRLTKYIPHVPTSKQLAAMMLPHREVFYGGAAGGGKSDWLLMSALQYVDVPQYSAILFRRKLTDLKLRGSLIDRSHDWLDSTDAKWIPGEHKWIFPSGATLHFGYLDTGSHSEGLDKFRYQSAHFQFIGFDELTQFFEEDYLYLFSRLRRTQCYRHTKDPDPNCRDCKEYAGLQRVPLRVRAASNPGGLGHYWVKRRFRIKRVEMPDGRVVYRGMHPKRPYVPALPSDNPFLDIEDYKKSLVELDPVTRDQYLKGDWDASSKGRFLRQWLRRYDTRGAYLVLRDKNGNEVASFHRGSCRLVAFCDPAASVREGPGDNVIWRRMPSWTVIGVFYVTPAYDMLLWDVYRIRAEVPDVLYALRKCTADHVGEGLEFIGIEANGLGIGVFQSAMRMGLPVRAVRTQSHDKLVRATDATLRMEQGKIYFPHDGDRHIPKCAKWLGPWESELFSWTGHPQEQSDQVDVLAYASRWVTEQAAGSERTLSSSELGGHVDVYQVTTADPMLTVF